MKSSDLIPLSFWSRVLRASRLDARLYEDVKNDNNAKKQAYAIVVIASLASGVGGAVAGAAHPGSMDVFLGLILGLGSAALGWYLWLRLTYLLGACDIFGIVYTTDTYAQLSRLLGFAFAPSLLRILFFLPTTSYLGCAIEFGVSGWLLVTGVFAVRQCFDVSTWRSVGPCSLGWAVYATLRLPMIVTIQGS